MIKIFKFREEVITCSHMYKKKLKLVAISFFLIIHVLNDIII